MKQTLLLLCAIPCLLTAQTVSKKELKEKPFFQQLVKNQQTDDQLMLRSDSTIRPDSIYIYRGEEKVFWGDQAITNDALGRKKEVVVKADLNGDGVINSDDWYKDVYTYDIGNKKFAEKIERFFYIENKWTASSIQVIEYNVYGNIVNAYESYYDFEKSEWLDGDKLLALELNEKGNAIAWIDSTLEEDEWTTMYWDLTYNTDNRYDTIFIYNYNDVEKKKGIAVEKMEFVYGENGKQTKIIYYDYKDNEWVYSHTVEYSYDDKGNLSSMKEIDNDGSVIDSEYYENVYPSTVANEEIFTVESAVYPNPVSDVLNVTIKGADLAIITLINATGGIVTQQNVQQPVVSVPVSSLPKGYYFLKVQTVQGTKTHKVIIK